jgi:hypothetical protein
MCLSVPIRASSIRLLASNAERVQKADGSVGRGAKGQGPAQTVALRRRRPHTPPYLIARAISFVDTPRESKFDSACFIERFELFGGKLEIQTGEIVLELRYLPRSNDRDY